MDELITAITQKYPGLKFTAGEQFSWSPASHAVIYKQGAAGKRATWALLHETGHALLGHAGYRADFQLVKFEMAAWEQAKKLGAELGIEIDEDHIQDCLDTYRDWLYRRSLCPNCNNKCLQQSDYVHYRCFNCHTTWKVSQSRFARTYRQSKNVPQPRNIFI